MSARIPLEQARSKLMITWFGGAAVPFLILVVQSILGKYGDNVQKTWAWFVPNTLPTLALILGVMGATAMKRRDARKVQGPYFRLALALSWVYLVAISLTLLLEPLSPYEPRELQVMSGYWLGPLQGLAVAAIGYLFVAEERK